MLLKEIKELNIEDLYKLHYLGIRSRKESKVIFRDPVTILICADGRKIISKAHNEEFDKEKGLLMCIAKANGITHAKLKRMINDAQIQENKE